MNGNKITMNLQSPKNSAVPSAEALYTQPVVDLRARLQNAHDFTVLHKIHIHFFCCSLTVCEQMMRTLKNLNTSDTHWMKVLFSANLHAQKWKNLWRRVPKLKSNTSRRCEGP